MDNNNQKSLSKEAAIDKKALITKVDNRVKTKVPSNLILGRY